MLSEEEQVQMIVDAAQSAANDHSLAGNHIAAARVISLIQLAKMFWTRLNPPKAEEPPSDAP